MLRCGIEAIVFLEPHVADDGTTGAGNDGAAVDIQMQCPGNAGAGNAGERQVLVAEQAAMYVALATSLGRERRSLGQREGACNGHGSVQE